MLILSLIADVGYVKSAPSCWCSLSDSSYNKALLYYQDSILLYTSYLELNDDVQTRLDEDKCMISIQRGINFH